MSQRPVCPACGQAVDPGMSGVVRVVEVLHGQDFGGEPAEVVEEGASLFFHEEHLPAESGRYRVVG